MAITGCRNDEPSAHVRLESKPATAAQLMPSRLTDDLPGLHNVVQASERVYSGSEPEGDKAFAALAALGVKTVLSVDGARPDVDAARRSGIRYLHVPIGYDGISEEEAAALTHAARATDGAIYVHCHHGRHRGPAAAAVLCAADGATRGKELLKILELAGTGKEYVGLWRDVEAFRPPPPDGPLPELVETAEVVSLTGAMAAVDRHWDDVKACRDAGWKTPASHPDLTPAQVALLLREALREARRQVPEGRFDSQFESWLGDAEVLAGEMESQLTAANPEEAGRTCELLEQSCRKCHATYRN
jgi:protein tyrosine phosphatase (PTP) superfamily phosphohydrolase (DUF442 family)